MACLVSLHAMRGAAALPLTGCGANLTDAPREEHGRNLNRAEPRLPHDARLRDTDEDDPLRCLLLARQHPDAPARAWPLLVRNPPPPLDRPSKPGPQPDQHHLKIARRRLC